MAPQLLKQQSENKNKLERSKSQEEAALVIQKHYRGYQVRNAKNSKDIGNLDPKSRKKLKAILNKWRGKSIYQVVMMDRANKLQDVVYFSLQVHLYNQHVISNLNNMNHRPVMLGNVMSTTSVSEFLGSKKCYGYRMPFQLNHTNMPINHNHTMDENMKNSIEESNWDSPLSRFPEARAGYRILKHSFAVRDQGVQVEMKEGVRFSNTDNSYNKFENDYKEAYQEPKEKPMKKPSIDNRYEYSTKQTEKKDPRKPAAEPKTKAPIGRSNTSNPVLELQSKFQSPNADEDDPPYNFQAILKKTNYNKRPSMEGRSVQYSSETIGSRYNGETAVRDRTYGGSGQPNSSGRVVKNYEDNLKQSKDFKNELNQQLSRASRTELLPGVMLEGSSYDL